MFANAESCVKRYGGRPHIHAHTAQEGNGRFCLSALRKTRTFVQVPHGPTAPLIPDGNAHAMPMRVRARATPHLFQSAQTATFMCVCVRMVSPGEGHTRGGHHNQAADTIHMRNPRPVW